MNIVTCDDNAYCYVKIDNGNDNDNNYDNSIDAYTPTINDDNNLTIKRTTIIAGTMMNRVTVSIVESTVNGSCHSFSIANMNTL